LRSVAMGRIGLLFLSRSTAKLPSAAALAPDDELVYKLRVPRGRPIDWFSARMPGILRVLSASEGAPGSKRGDADVARRARALSNSLLRTGIPRLQQQSAAGATLCQAGSNALEQESAACTRGAATLSPLVGVRRGSQPAVVACAPRWRTLLSPPKMTSRRRSKRPG
jgi:hypothetical protein